MTSISSPSPSPTTTANNTTATSSPPPSPRLEVCLIRSIQGIRYGVLEFLGVGTTFDIFQNILLLYCEYDVLTSPGYSVLILQSFVVICEV
ncbi:hypothetical protein Tco_1023248 [Tanacetum coccineum]